jgi:hypothetical protein
LKGLRQRIRREQDARDTGYAAAVHDAGSAHEDLPFASPKSRSGRERDGITRAIFAVPLRDRTLSPFLQTLQTQRLEASRSHRVPSCPSPVPALSQLFLGHANYCNYITYRTTTALTRPF